MKINIRVILLICTLALSYWAIKPLFVTGFFPVHDDTQPARIYVMAKALTEGQFPVRMVSDLGYGYGYPLYNFYAPLPYYIGALVNLAGFDVITSAKIMYAIGILLPAVSMYFLMLKTGNPLSAVTSGILYVYAPYHAINIYIRGAVGEYYAYGFLPFVVLGIYMIFENNLYPKLKKGILLTAFGLSGVFLSHNILGLLTVMLCVLLIIIFIIFKIAKKINSNQIFALIFSLVLGLGLSSFFVIPAFSEKQYTKVESLTQGGSKYVDHFVYPDQLWDSPWGFGGSAPGREDGISFKIGKIHLIVFFFSLPVIIYVYLKKKMRKRIFWLYLISGIFLGFSVLMTLDISSFIWKIIPILSFVQYPWRFINFIILFLAIFASGIFENIIKRINILVAFFIIVSVIYINGKYFIPKKYISSDSEAYIAKNIISYKISKISDEYLPKDITVPTSVEEIVKDGITQSENVKIIEKQENSTKKEYKLNVVKNSSITTNIAFFPGWEAFLDGKSQKIDAKNGKITIFIPAGSHMLVFRFLDTPVRTISNSISIFSIFLILYLSLSTSGLFIWPKNKDR